jgi:hypothetical protein
MQRKFILKALIYIHYYSDQVETPVLTYDETAVTQAKMKMMWQERNESTVQSSINF